jgi:hypothetical protein
MNVPTASFLAHNSSPDLLTVVPFNVLRQREQVTNGTLNVAD